MINNYKNDNSKYFIKMINNYKNDNSKYFYKMIKILHVIVIFASAY